MNLLKSLLSRKLSLVATPIFYTNGPPHLGHAYTLLLSATVRRAMSLNRTEKIYLSTGTDEHGLKIQKCAKK